MASKEENTPLGNIGFGILLIVIGIGCFFWFAHLETHGGRIRTHALIVLAYSLLGKWGVLGLCGGLGSLLTFFGVKGLLTKQGAQGEPEEPNERDEPA